MIKRNWFAALVLGSSVAWSGLVGLWSFDSADSCQAEGGSTTGHGNNKDRTG